MTCSDKLDHFEVTVRCLKMCSGANHLELITCTHKYFTNANGKYLPIKGSCFVVRAGGNLKNVNLCSINKCNFPSDPRPICIFRVLFLKYNDVIFEIPLGLV